jgi:hypothetical protein
MLKGRVGLILPHQLGKLCLLLRMMSGFQNYSKHVEKWVAFTSGNFTTGVKKSNLFNEVYSYSEHKKTGYFDYLLDLTSYDYSYELCLQLNWGFLINRQLHKQWLINKKLKDVEGSTVSCPATEPAHGWFSVNQDYPAMLCEIPILNLSIGLPIESMELLKADGPLLISNNQTLEDQKIVLLLICGANFAKHWLLVYWKSLNDQLVNASFKTMVIIGPDEKKLVPEIIKLNLPFIELTLLDDLMNVIQSAHGVISNDCGPMHVALMLEKPTLAIFGPTNPNSWFIRTNKYQNYVQTEHSYINRMQAPLAKTWPSWPEPSIVFEYFINLINFKLPNFSVGN